MNKSLLSKIEQDVKQKISECLSQAIGEDRQEADAVLDLKTHVSDPFLNWDLIYRNLINTFSDGNVICSTNKRGMWTVLLLYDKSSNLLISFMRDTRFQTIKKAKNNNQPQYIRSLLSLNAELQAERKQIRITDSDIDDKEDDTELERILNEMCSNFVSPIDNSVSNHVMVVFSNKFGHLSSLNAYVLDRDLDIVCEQNWLDSVKPVVSNKIETVDTHSISLAPSLKPKSLERLHKKELVSLKDQEGEKQA